MTEEGRASHFGGEEQDVVELDAEFDIWDDGIFPGLRFAQHPLISEALPVARGNEAKANAAAERARAQLLEREEAGDFEGAVRLHHHDYWAKALLAYQSRLDAVTYWRLAGEFYCDYAAPSAWFAAEWAEVFADPRPGREAMMTADERGIFDHLSDVVDVKRGFARDGGEKGFSWTTSLETARHFALQAASYEGATEPRVAYGTVEREDVVCVLLRRGEEEVVVRPASVAIAEVAPLI